MDWRTQKQTNQYREKYCILVINTIPVAFLFISVIHNLKCPEGLKTYKHISDFTVRKKQVWFLFTTNLNIPWVVYKKQYTYVCLPAALWTESCRICWSAEGCSHGSDRMLPKKQKMRTTITDYQRVQTVYCHVKLTTCTEITQYIRKNN